MSEFEEAKELHQEKQGVHTVLVKLAHETAMHKKLEPETIFSMVKAKLEASSE